MASGPLTHFPLLLNPLLNCIFNNPNYNRAPFKNTIHQLARHNEYTILVPPSFVLQEGLDPTSKTSLKELCYNSEDFLRAHVIRTSSPCSTTVAPMTKVQSVIYNTVAGHQILIKNGYIFTGKGFNKSVRARILSINYINSFCDYFPKGSKYMVIMIDDTLFGSSMGTMSPSVSETFGGSADTNGKFPNRNVRSHQEEITFDTLLRSYPLLSLAVSDKFYKLFHHHNDDFQSLRGHTRKSLSTIKHEFDLMMKEAYKIVQESVSPDAPESQRTSAIINHILALNPGLDLNKLVHEYLEIHIYDKLWNQIVIQYNFANDNETKVSNDAVKYLTRDIYQELSTISLNQQDIPITKPWHMNVLLARITLAVKEFSKLEDPTIFSSAAKIEIIANTFKILTNNTNDNMGFLSGAQDFVVVADTLIGLLIMVVIHARITNLEAHVYYIKNFSYHANDGYLNYIMSNLDAVLLHLSPHGSDNDQYADLVAASRDNARLWNAIHKGDLHEVIKLVEQVDLEYPSSELPINHWLKSRTGDGESCLLLSLNARHSDIFSELLNHNLSWFTIEDILFDINTLTGANLLIVALTEELPEATRQIVEFLMVNCTFQEQRAYVNWTDITGRSAGHYLFHDISLIDTIGHLIDWEIKDQNSHTPLFSLCRCYDHSDYINLIKRGFDCVYQHYGPDINFDAHIDKTGNTLLHVISKGIDQTQLLNNDSTTIDVNRFNNRNMTPLALYVKYNRLDNLKQILNDKRLLLTIEDTRHFSNVFDYLGPAVKDTGKYVVDFFLKNYVATNKSNNQTKDHNVVTLSDPIIGALNGKFDPNSGKWYLLFADTQAHSSYNSIQDIKQLMYLVKLQHPLSVFPDEDSFWLNFSMEVAIAPLFNKFRMNRLVDRFNMLLMSVSLQNNIDTTRLRTLVEPNNESSTFDSVHAINSSVEKSREQMGNIKLSGHQIQEIEYFLKYSVGDLKRFGTAVSKLNRLLSVTDIKHSDKHVVHNISLSMLSREAKLSVGKWLSTLENDHGYSSAYDKLLEFGLWMDLASIELMRNITKVLDKLQEWKDCYVKIKELNEEIVAYEEKVLAVNPSSESSRRSTFNVENNLQAVSEPEPDTSFFNFSNILENKKTRYNKLLIMKSEKVKQIVRLSQTIKLEHEVVAAEIADFLQFRSKFFAHGVKQFVQSRTTILWRSSYELSLQLRQLRAK